MPTINETISNAVNSLITKRSNIRTAIMNKGVDVPSDVTFADLPSYIAMINTPSSSTPSSSTPSSSTPEMNSYLVSGAGDDSFNGVYTYSGTNDGNHPYYSNGERFLEYIGGWGLYYSYTYDSTSPAYGKNGDITGQYYVSAMGGATSPAPTVSVYEGNSGVQLESSYIVTGAGSSKYNGTYVIDGTYNNQNYYTNGESYMWFGSNEWCLGNNVGDSRMNYACSGTDPTGTWTTVFGTSPAPTVTAPGGSSSSSSSGNAISDVWGGDLYNSEMASKQWNVSGVGDGSGYAGTYVRYSNYVLNGAPIYYDPTRGSNPYYYLIRRKRTNDEATYGYWEFIATPMSISSGSTLPSGSFGKTNDLSGNNPAGSYTGLGSVGGSISVSLYTGGCGC